MEKATFKVGLKRFLWLKKEKNTMLWTYVISYLKSEDIFLMFYRNKIAKNKSNTVYGLKSNEEQK